jgi:hypothetical protein
MNPILPGAIHPDQAGEMLKNPSLAVPRDSLIVPELRKSQTFSATPQSHGSRCVN